MKSFKHLLGIAALLTFTVQCEQLIDDSLLESPNAPSPSQVNPDFLLNNIQFAARNVYNSSSVRGAELTRMRQMNGATYENAYDQTTFDGLYQSSYTGVFVNTKTLIPIAEKNGLFFHKGVAQALQAYTMITLVDMFGDVPYTEALDEKNLNPKLDTGASVYAAALTLLDSAKVNLTNPARRASLQNDLFYPTLNAADRQTAWVRVVNTIKLKALLNMRHVDNTVAAQIDALIAENLLITSLAHDFKFQYGTNVAAPDSRHPEYPGNYTSTPGSYMAMTFMNMLLTDKTVTVDGAQEFLPDPRLRYYIYRQTITNGAQTSASLPCIAAERPAHFVATDPFCRFTAFPGYWGRNHLISDGIPPDGQFRSTFGVYPIGGEFDANQGLAVSSANAKGLGGAGIQPILMSMFTHFMLAEFHLTVKNDAAAAKASLETGVAQSMQTVRDMGRARATGSGFEIAGAAGAAITGAAVTYRTAVGARYDAAADDTERLRTIVKEYYLAAFPNGYEAYNAMRRTGFPSRADGIQSAFDPNPGKFWLTLGYPASLVNRNRNVDAKTDNHVRTFWDNQGAANRFDF